MESSLKNISPKPLTIKEVYQLYKLLEDGIPEKDEKYLIDEVLKILDGISTYAFKQGLRILYGDNFHINRTPGEFAIMFIDGIKKTNFISFMQIMKDLRGNS